MKILVLWDGGCRDLVELLKTKVDDKDPVEGYSAYCWSFEDKGEDPDNYVPYDDLEITHAVLFARTPKELLTSYGMNCISHEALHVVSQALRLRGMPLSDDTEEAYTWTTSYVVETICTFIGMTSKE